MIEEAIFQGIWFEIDTDNNEAKVIQYKNKNKYKDNIEIPQSVEFDGIVCLVRSIDENAFYGCDGLLSVTIPNTVTSIGSMAFYGCSSLSSINIPPKISCIDLGVFRGCCGLISINIPDGVTCIDAAAFKDCRNLASITIPNSVTSIDGYAFCGCTRLVSVIIGKKVCSISHNCFSGCSKLVNVICLADNVPNIAKDAFTDSLIEFSSLHVLNTTIDLYKKSETWDKFNKIVSIREDNLNREFELDGVWYKFVSIMNEVEVIKYKDNQYIGDIQIPKFVEFEDGIGYVTSIGEYAFSRCTRLTSITIPDSVKYIKNHAFEYCDKLTSISIPNSVMSIGGQAFECCRGLKSVVIPKSVMNIGCEAFCGCINLSSVKIPNSIVDIGFGAFLSCFQLKSITIPDSVKIIGPSAFSGCKSLSRVSIGKNVTNILYQAFEGCPKLTDILCYTNKVPITSEDAFKDSFPEKISLFVPWELVAAYKAECPWSQFDYIGDLREI